MSIFGALKKIGATISYENKERVKILDHFINHEGVMNFLLSGYFF
jgi:hypothetical protein